MAQILVVEDNASMREGIVQTLEREGHEVRAAAHGHEGAEAFELFRPAFTITDLKMEDMDGIAVLKHIRSKAPNALVMVMTAYGTIETAVEAMKLGAFDFIEKPFSLDLLRMKVRSALELARTRAENEYLRAEARSSVAPSMIGDTEVMRSIRDQISRVARTDTTVLITGESGTGKELVARAIHEQSARSSKPFIKVDCAALAEGVLESELFGHERGAFTGATYRKEGRFELADGGTIFLDEIGEISHAVQLRLLRVLQDRCIERVGGTRTLNVDVRIISATNKILKKEIEAGRFREDLYYRLHIVPIEVPPLRRRRSDIPAMISYFLDKVGRKHGRRLKISAEALKVLEAYQWPGNIRELENLIERLYVLAAGPEIKLDDLPDPLKKSNDHVDLSMPSSHVGLNRALEDLEKQLILRAYEEAGGIKTRTAQILGIKTSALYYKLEKYGIYSRDE